MSRQKPEPLAGNTLPECSHLGDLGRVVLCWLKILQCGPGGGLPATVSRAGPGYGSAL